MDGWQKQIERQQAILDYLSKERRALGTIEDIEMVETPGEMLHRQPSASIAGYIVLGLAAVGLGWYLLSE